MWAEVSNRRQSVIGVGGIMSADDAVEKFEAGAQLVQIYTCLIDRGPKLICDIADDPRL